MVDCQHDAQAVDEDPDGIEHIVSVGALQFHELQEKVWRISLLELRGKMVPLEQHPSWLREHH